MTYPYVAGAVLLASDLNTDFAAKTDTAMVQNAQTGTSYSFALADASKLLTTSNASPVSVTVTKQATVTWVTGTQLRLVNLGAGTTTLVADTGVTINGNVALKQYQGGTLIRTASDVWLFVPTASSALSLIGAAAPSAVSSVSVNSVFSATYQNYLVLAAVSFASTDRPMLRLRASGTSSSANYSAYYMDINTSPALVAGFAASDKILAAQTGSTGLCFIVATFCNVYLAEPSLFTVDCVDGTSTPRRTLGRHTASTSFDGIELLSEGGQNMTGSLRIYGYSNS